MPKSNKKKIIIELDGDWVLRHRNDDELPIEVIKAELSKDKEMTFTDSTLTSLTLIYSGSAANYSDVKAFLTRLFKSRYPEDKTKDILSIRQAAMKEEEPAEEKDEAAQIRDTDQEDIRQRC